MQKYGPYAEFLVLNKKERSTIISAIGVCQKAIAMLESDDPDDPNFDCPFLNAELHLQNINN